MYEDVAFGGSAPVDEPVREWVSWNLVRFDAEHEQDRLEHYDELDRIERRRRAIRKEFLRRELVREGKTLATGSLTLTSALSALEGVRKRGPLKWTALCPAHDDNMASLAVFEHSDKPEVPTFHCSAGCSFTDIRAAIRARL